jgi:AraC-like DNA-binding protein
MKHTSDTQPVRMSRRDFGDGTVLSVMLSNIRVSMMTAGPHVIAQPKAAPAGSAAVYVCTPLAGRITVRQDGSQADILPGQVVLFDSSRPYRLCMPERFQLVLIRSPHAAVGVRPVHTSPLTASLWPGTSGVGAITSDLLAAVGNHLAELDAPGAEAMDDSIRSMLMSLLAERLAQGPGHDPDAARQMLLMRVQAFARGQLPDLSLGPASLAQKHNISLRYLQLLFAEHGTSPAKWIRTERLAHCLEDLRNPRYDHLTVAAIGERWGFYGAPQFSRLFRDRYGRPPGDTRKQRVLAAS